MRDVIDLQTYAGVWPPVGDPVRITPRARTIGIVRDTADKHNVSYEWVMSNTRKRPVAWARQEAYYRVRMNTNLSLPQIGRFFSRDHTSVLAGIRSYMVREGIQ
jgi:chromosomal replication initiation ATPase DnaA